MHEHDQELIMALAEGTLDDAATTAAHAEIQTCPECTEDLELHRLALSALDDVPAVYLTATESARLHDALRREVVGARTPSVRSKPTFAWGRWLPAAGIAAVFLVAIVSLPVLVGGIGAGDSDDAADTTAAATERATDELALEAVPEAGGSLSADDASSNTEAAAETTAAPETTESMADTTEASATELAVTEALPELGDVAELDLDQQLDTIDRERRLSVERSDLAKSFDESLSSCVVANTSPENAPILGIPVDSDSLLVGVVVGETGDQLLLVAYVPEDLEATVFATYQLFGCELVEVLP